MAGQAKQRRTRTEEVSPCATAAVLRCDLLPHGMNPGKERSVLDLLRAWRHGAATVAALQWRMFQSNGRFDAQADDATEYRKAFAGNIGRVAEALTVRYGLDRPEPPKEGEKVKRKRRQPPSPPGLVDPLAGVKAAIGAARTQMVRKQVVGVLESFISNRQNDFVAIVRRSTLDELTRHMLFAVNRARAWGDLAREIRIVHEMEDGTKRTFIVSPDVRRLARAIWRQVMARHRKPSMRRIGMVIDQREATLLPATSASSFPLWLRLGTLAKPVQIPLRTYPYFEEREGQRKLTVQVNQDRVTGRLSFGVITDIGKACEKAKAAYAVKAKGGEVALDFGLSTLLASPDGGLFGKGFLKVLKARDATLTGIARHWQRANPGGRLRDCPRYQDHAQRTRGFVETELRRALNTVVEVHTPLALILEDLDFRAPGLSARMNRLLTNCGRSVLKAKLVSLEQELGITSTQVNAAYTSQTCSCCGYVDKRNRRTQSQFVCLWCGLELHADVNAARNIEARRSRPIGSGWVAKGQVLAVLVQRHVERWPMERRVRPQGRTGSQRLPADPRLTNPYHRDWRDAARYLTAGSNPSENRMAA